MTGWMKRGLCSKNEMALELFFEEYLKSRKTYDLVNATCKACPVRKACLNYGILTKSTGVWGGKWLQTGTVVDTITKSVLEENTI